VMNVVRPARSSVRTLVPFSRRRNRFSIGFPLFFFRFSRWGVHGEPAKVPKTLSVPLLYSILAKNARLISLSFVLNIKG
ncbi:hypothetical protein, partial [Oscillibacter sp.]|uniref:hypothetical protein n=1 Tax=Oscillibacter sp. TaxID=1945593 RepID=UPI0025E9037D